ncbi:MAG: acetoin utilization protein AcuC [Thermoleophilia bacterium]|nr:acetoin utilization protein AcuC [Thermoleophilia bacterium]
MTEQTQESSSPDLVQPEPLVVVYSAELAGYNFGPEHPLKPTRYQLTMELLHALGWLDHPSVSIEAPRPATMSELLAVHSYSYIQAVETAQAIARRSHEPMDLAVYGLGSQDNPLFPDIHDASLLYTGASICAMKALLERRAVHAYSPAGGQHHAHRSYASGFCIYNDCAAAIAAALTEGWRVAYIDLDAHHGDGVQSIFYEDPRVLTISIHESGHYLFPGTGEIDEIGVGAGRGTSLNIPLPPFSGNDAIIAAVERIVEPAVHLFRPDVVVTQAGADSHHADPLTHLCATIEVFPQIAARLHQLVHECCQGRWLILGGGGYDPADVTPRAWAAFIGTVLGYDTDNVKLPESWRRASRAAGGDPPALLLEDSRPAYTVLGGGDFESVLSQVEQGPLAMLRKIVG